jgi:carbamoyl-phosphate synthase small subunit
LVAKTNLTHKSKDDFEKIHPTGVLVLEDGTFFKGYGFGYEGATTGEVCFNTSITGYQEIISDPSYAGQIINFTFPHIGNVGTNNDDNESDKIWTRGVIFNSELSNPSNYRAVNHLASWLRKNKIIGITGLDTRNLTNFIRDKGAPKGAIAFSKKGKFNINKLKNLAKKWNGLKNLDLAGVVTTKKNYKWIGFKTWKKESRFTKNKFKIFKIVAIDYGIKKIF